MTAPPAALRETPLSPRLVLLTLGGDTLPTSWGANCLALAGTRATLLVDPLVAPAHARLVEDAVRRRGFPPVRHVALTHHHTDHALGAGHFARAGAEVVCHARCADLMRAQHAALVAERRGAPELAGLFADADPYAPGTTYEDRHVLDLGGGVRAELVHLGHGHTPGDSVVLLRGEDVVAVGDLVFDGYHFNYEEADLAALPRRLEAIAALPASVVVPGHGRPRGRALLDDQASYHAEIARLCRGAADDEAAREAILRRFPGHALAMAVESAIAAHRSI